MGNTFIFTQGGEAVQFGREVYFPDANYALEAISKNTSMFANGDILAIVNFDDQVCKFVELRLEMTVIELDD